jgi:hypothetical protein
MTKTNGLPFGRGWDRIANLNLFSGDHDTVNQQLDQLAFLFKGGFTDPLLYSLTERFNRLHHARKLIVMPYIRFQLPLLFCDHR